MDRKKKVTYSSIKFFIISNIIFLIVFYILVNFFELKLANSDLFIGGFIFVSISIAVLPFIYISYKHRLIFIYPWYHTLWGGEYSWWIDGEIETDVFWRSILLSIAGSIFFFILGISFIMLSLFVK